MNQTPLYSLHVPIALAAIAGMIGLALLALYAPRCDPTANSISVGGVLMAGCK